MGCGAERGKANIGHLKFATPEDVFYVSNKDIEKCLFYE